MSDSRPEQRRRSRPVHLSSLQPQTIRIPNCTYRAQERVSLGTNTESGKVAANTAPLRHSVAAGNGSGDRRFPLNQGNDGWGERELSGSQILELAAGSYPCHAPVPERPEV